MYGNLYRIFVQTDMMWLCTITEKVRSVGRCTEHILKLSIITIRVEINSGMSGEGIESKLLLLT
jgi:hypothetical protein